MKIIGLEDRIPGRAKKKFLTRGAAFLLGITFAYVLLSNIAYPTHPFFKYGRFRWIKTTLPVDAGQPYYSRLPDLNLSPEYYSSFLSTLQVPISKIFGLKIRTIVIDPGHGGEDPGAIGQMGTKEKDITLDIGKRLQRRLSQHYNYVVHMTRWRDETLTLEDRITFANENHTDLYISIHVNSIPSNPRNVIETYYFGPHSDRHALMLAQRENRGNQYTISDFKGIINKITNTLKTQESNVLASSIQRSLYRNIKRDNKDSINFGIKTAPFIVLLGVDAPSVLTEVTCISHIEEEKKLNNGRYREAIAKYLEQGIKHYIDKKIESGEEDHYARK